MAAAASRRPSIPSSVTTRAPPNRARAWRAFPAHIQRGQHPRGSMSIKHRALIEQRVAVEEAAGAADLAAARPRCRYAGETGPRCRAGQGPRRPPRRCARKFVERRDAKRGAMEHELEAELAFIHVDRAAAGDRGALTRCRWRGNRRRLISRDNAWWRPTKPVGANCRKADAYRQCAHLCASRSVPHRKRCCGRLRARRYR